MDPEKIVEEDEYEIIDGQLPLRLSSTASIQDGSVTQVKVSVHPSPKKNAMVVSIKPPLQPASDIPHAPCDIVLVIDVSGSMSMAAPPPATDDSETLEDTGLSVLDLTKHGARTVIETLNQKDRLGVVTFSSDAKVVYPLSNMTEESKKVVLQRIEALRPQSCTNLWHGLKEGLKSFQNAPSVPGNVQALYVLTDGHPNHMCPKQGYVTKLQSVLEKHMAETHVVPSIHTFGFGYSIRSGLLQSISEVGAGTFAFIPDAGMIGTVFVHGVANLYTTFATQAKLRIPTKSGEISIPVGNLQYGQSRDIVVQYKDIEGGPPVMPVELTYVSGGIASWTVSDQHQGSLGTYSMPPEVYDYHFARVQICDFLRSLYPRRADQEYVPLAVHQLPQIRTELEDLIKQLKVRGHTDEQNTSLLCDLAGENPNGQVRLAISNENYYTKWGQHYLLSVLNAHTHQICNSFKDPGPLQYGKNSPLFLSCRQELDDAFDNLPAPKPSLITYSSPHSHKKMQPIKMGLWNRSSNPCFAGHCKIRIDENDSSVALRDLRAGMLVWTPCGPRRVKAVVATRVHDIVLCSLGSLWITPWHPIQHEGSWVFPWMISHNNVDFSGEIYSILLDPHPDHDAHAIMIDDHVCVSLGHGIQAGNDIRAHTFFGDYHKVVRNLKFLPRDTHGVFRCKGIKRDPMTGLVNAFASCTSDKKRWRGLQTRALLKSQTPLRRSRFSLIS